MTAQAKSKRTQVKTGVKTDSKPDSKAVKTKLHSVLSSLKPLVTVTEKSALCDIESCSEKEPCDQGWFFEDNIAHPCKTFQSYYQQQRLLNNFLGLDMSKYQKDWDSLEIEHESWRIIQRYCAAPNTKDFVDGGLLLLLQGPRGTGKSQALMKLTEATRRETFRSLFINWSAWWMKVKGSYVPSSAESEVLLLNKLIEPDFLAIDEVGTGLDSESTRAWSLFEQAICLRYDALKATAISTNLKREEFAVQTTGLSKEQRMRLLVSVKKKQQKLEDLPSRVFSRIDNNTHWISFDGKCFREQEDKARVEPLIERVVSEARGEKA